MDFISVWSILVKRPKLYAACIHMRTHIVCIRKKFQYIAIAIENKITMYHSYLCMFGGMYG